MVTSAQPHDTVLAVPLVTKTLEKYPSLEIFAVDQGYCGTNTSFYKEKRLLSQSQNSDKKFQKKMDCGVAWNLHDRRLSKDYEVLPQNSEKMIQICAIRRNLRRITKI